MKTLLVAGGRCDIIQLKNTAKHMKDSSEKLYIIGIDGGMKTLKEAGIKPDIGVGDFDSVNVLDYSDTPIEKLCPEKDDTDTFFAAKEMLSHGFEEFLLVGVIGARLDHTLANLSILLMLDTAGKSAKAVDDYSEMEIVSSGPAFIEDTYSFFSLLNITGEAEGVTIENAKYPLENAAIEYDYQYAVSNEVLPGKVARVSVAKGRLLLIKVI